MQHTLIMPITEFQPVLDPGAFIGACAGLAVGVSAIMMDVDVKRRRDLYAATIFVVPNTVLSCRIDSAARQMRTDRNNVASLSSYIYACRRQQEADARELERIARIKKLTGDTR